MLNKIITAFSSLGFLFFYFSFFVLIPTAFAASLCADEMRVISGVWDVVRFILRCVIYIYGDDGGSTSCPVSQVTSPLSIGGSVGRVIDRIRKKNQSVFSIGYIHVIRYHILDKRIFF